MRITETGSSAHLDSLRSAVMEHPELGKLDGGKLDSFLPQLYNDLRSVARFARAQHRPPEGLSTTSIVHEAYLKLKKQSQIEWVNKAQFMHIAALAMRNILVDNARHHGRLKRGGNQVRVPLDESVLVSARLSEDVLTLDAALDRLSSKRHRWAAVVTCRVFGGMGLGEVATALSVSLATVKRDWQSACLWLKDEIGDTPGL